MTSSVATHDQIQEFELINLKNDTIYEVLDHVKGLVLLIQSCGNSVTQRNIRKTRRRPSEDAILT